MGRFSNIKIYCENTGTEKSYPFGTTLLDIIADQKIDIGYPILGAMVNNTLKELDYLIYKPKTVRFIDYRHPDGRRMYFRSLSMVLFKAVVDLYPDDKLQIQQAVSNGLYCIMKDAITNDTHLEVVNKLRKRMQEIIDQDIPFEREELRTEEALKIFEKFKLEDKCTLMRTRRQFYSSVYKFDNVVNYFYGYLVPSSGYLKHFDLIKYYEGMLLLAPRSDNPEQLGDVIIQHKLFEIFREFKEWVEIVGIPNVGQLNLATQNGKISEIIKVSEALQEKKLACIADMIHDRKEDVRVVFISGPSSSGKTTFAKRLSVQLRVVGFKPLVLSMDNYFKDRIYTPKDNPLISEMIPDIRKFKVYVSALTPLSIDSNNRIPTADNRLIRRLVRDSLYRNYSALETLQRWPSVKRGEGKHIFPFQEEADVMFNTALLFELGVLKRWAEPLLKEVPPIAPEYSEARRLLKFLSYILPISEKEVPPVSILREFLDGSSFDYS